MYLSWSPILLLLLPLWLLFALWARRVARGPRGDVLTGICLDINWLYAKLFHRLKVIDAHLLPSSPVVNGRPIIIIANHTAGIDPILIQASVPYFVRWMMAADMRAAPLEEFWQYANVVFVERFGKPDLRAFRAALGTLESGQAIGIFPEGRLRGSPLELNDFLPGIGLLVAKSNALLLPVVITGTPFCYDSWPSLWQPSASRVHVKPLIDPQTLNVPTDQLAVTLRGLYVRWLTELGLPPTPPQPRLADPRLIISE